MLCLHQKFLAVFHHPSPWKALVQVLLDSGIVKRDWCLTGCWLYGKAFCIDPRYTRLCQGKAPALEAQRLSKRARTVRKWGRRRQTSTSLFNFYISALISKMPMKPSETAKENLTSLYAARWGLPTINFFKAHSRDLCWGSEEIANLEVNQKDDQIELWHRNSCWPFFFFFSFTYPLNTDTPWWKGCHYFCKGKHSKIEKC